MVAVNMPLLAERKNQGRKAYKHVAPPEQEPRHNEHHFSGKASPIGRELVTNLHVMPIPSTSDKYQTAALVREHVLPPGPL